MKKLMRVTATFVVFLQCSAFLKAQVVLNGGGLMFAEQGGTFAADNLADGATPFTSSDLGPSLGIDFHIAANVNDLTYGNGNSWIGNDPNSFCGVNLGAATVSVQSIAFGRDNGGEAQEFGDRNLGLYTLQFTMAANPDESTPDSDWTTIGTLDYQGANDGFMPQLRHRYNFTPVDATGIRLLVPGNGLNGGTAIDELEVYAAAGEVIPIDIPSSLDITPASGFNVTWDGNDGDHFDATAPPGGAMVPDNLALASNGATAFTHGDLGPELSIGFHVAANLNDGVYGNSNSWIGASSAAEPWFAAVDLGGLMEITQVAWGRDNGNGAFDDSAPGSDCCGGQADDRSAGVYELQVSTDDNPGPGSTWTTLATLDYKGNDDVIPGGGFTSYFRHEYEVSTEGGDPITVTGVRVLVPATGLGGGTAIDEIEVYNKGLSKILGDMNGDRMLNAFDIEGFVQALVDPAGYVAQTGMDPTVCGDINGDGMLNAFDIDSFVALLSGGAPVVQPMQLRHLAALKLPHTDTDGDGQSNAMELLFGTDPDDASDTFKVAEIKLEERSLNLKWPTVPGKQYRVTATESLDKSWVPVEGIGIVKGDGTTVRAIVPLTAESRHLFYRVELVVSPAEQ